MAFQLVQYNAKIEEMFLTRQAVQDFLSQREIVINPYDEQKLGVLSYNLSLAGEVVDPQTGEVISLTDFQLLPDQFILANTKEYLILSPQIAGFVTGRSSLARLGVLTTFDSHLVEPGFEGSLTLALKNLSSKPVLLREGLEVVQISFLVVQGGKETFIAKDKKYVGEDKVVESQLCRELEDE